MNNDDERDYAEEAFNRRLMHEEYEEEAAASEAANVIQLALTVAVPAGTSPQDVAEALNRALDEDDSEPRLPDWGDWIVGPVQAVTKPEPKPGPVTFAFTSVDQPGVAQIPALAKEASKLLEARGRTGPFAVIVTVTAEPPVWSDPS